MIDLEEIKLRNSSTKVLFRKMKIEKYLLSSIVTHNGTLNVANVIKFFLEFMQYKIIH